MNEQENKMGSTPILRLILSMALPAMFSMVINALYNIVDSIFVAQLGENALTAVSLAFPIQTLMIAVAVGTGVGLNSLISRRLGEKRQQDANQAADHGLFLAVASGLVFALAGFLFVPSFFRIFTNDFEIFSLGCSYSYIVTIFSLGSFVQIISEKMIQATGNMVIPMVSGLVGAVTNIILDPIFIFGYFGVPAMGVAGAAIATVIGQFIGMGVCLVALLYKQKLLTISIKNFRMNFAAIKEIYSVGLPSIIMQSIASVLVTLLNGILIAFSGAAVSVLGVYFKLQSFVFMPVFGITQGTMPVLGYNYGAGNRKRLTDALKISIGLAAAVMFGGMVVFWAVPEQLLMMFNASAEMLSIGIPALRTISMGFTLAAVGIMLSTFFQAVGCGKNSLFISILRQVVIILPVAYLFSKIYGVTGVWMAFPIAEAAAAVVSVFVFRSLYRTNITHLEPRESN